MKNRICTGLSKRLELVQINFWSIKQVDDFEIFHLRIMPSPADQSSWPRCSILVHVGYIFT